MSRYFKTLVAVVGLAALSGCGGGSSGSSGSSALPYDEVLAPVKDCVVGMLGSLEAIESEFPGFRENEVRLAQRNTRSLLSPEELAAVVVLKRRGSGYEDYVKDVRTAADDVADVLGELRDGSPDVARGMWFRLR